MTDAEYKGLMVFAAVITVVVLAYGILSMQDNRSPAGKIAGAIYGLSEGAGEARLEDRMPDRRAGDAVKDAGDNIKDGADQ